MNLSTLVRTNLSSIAAIVAAMALVSLIEMAIPLHARGRAHRMHLGPNLALTFLTFATNVFFNAALLLLVAWCQHAEFGLLRWAALPPVVAGVIGVVALDLSFYVAHVAMHRIPAFWNVHRVHHSDPVVDVTTTIRQHPLEGVIRYVFMAIFALSLGVGVGPFVVYRVWSVLNGLLEHANIRVLPWLNDVLSLVTTWPHMHKIHHSRIPRETDTNYGNIFSIWDRIFFTFTPARRGTDISYGLDGFDDPKMQTTRGLLALPFHDHSLPNTEARRLSEFR